MARRPCPCVDEAGGEVIPGGVRGERRIGQAGPHAVAQPALELDEPGHHALDAFVTPAGVVGRWRIRRRVERFAARRPRLVAGRLIAGVGGVAAWPVAGSVGQPGRR
ncbi:MAG: hypothetical protein WKF58_17290 [Ilumatobacteraceae bacterium]